MGFGPLFYCPEQPFEEMPFASAETETKVREIAERIASSERLELVDAEWKGSSALGTLRIYIDKPGGVTHTDCENVSRQLSAHFDVEDFFPDSYNLEVSSPGLDRKLFKPADYERFAGQKAKIKLHDSLEGDKQITGRLSGVENGKIAIEVKKGSKLEFPFEDIQEARLVVEF